MKNDDFKSSRIIIIVVCSLVMLISLGAIPLIAIFEIAKGAIVSGVIKIVSCALVFIVASVALGITVSWIKGKKMIDKMLEKENKDESK